VFALSRFMGTSIAMTDRHYGHLAVDSYQASRAGKRDSFATQFRLEIALFGGEACVAKADTAETTLATS
jgi:hypothetical protein